MRVLAFAALLGGCNQLLGLDNASGITDARDDGMTMSSDGQVDDSGIDATSCFGTGLETICLSAPPMSPFVFAAAAPFDTDTHAACQSLTSVNACTIVGSSIQISATVRVIGSRPLILLAATTINVSGTIDASSDATQVGAGTASGTAACGSPSNGTVQGTSGGGGGAGGSFGGRGGDGGFGDELAASGAESPGGTAAQAQAITSLTLRGGCSGTRGANGTASGSGTGGAGGAGGGAVYLIAGTSITITSTGKIDASGRGGAGGGARSGGGGGGSGGLIGLDAPSVSNSGTLVANSGAGGSGGAQAINGPGSGDGPPGEDGGTPTTKAAGGRFANLATYHAGPGGDGTAGVDLMGETGDGAPDSYQDGGGGGGGGAGFIVVYPPQSLGGTVSPPPRS